MKKSILLVLLILLSIKTIAQENYFVSLGFDPKLAIDGAYSYDHTPVADIQFKTGTRLENGFEVGIQFEYAFLNPSYLSGGLFGNYVLSNWKETIFYSIGTEVITIERGRYGTLKNKKINVKVTFGLNAEIRLKIKNGFQVGFIANLTHRRDLKEMYNDQVFFKTNGHIRFILQNQR